MADPNANTTADSASKVASSPSEFSLRPLRILKRADHASADLPTPTPGKSTLGKPPVLGKSTISCEEPRAEALKSKSEGSESDSNTQAPAAESKTEAPTAGSKSELSEAPRAGSPSEAPSIDPPKLKVRKSSKPKSKSSDEFVCRPMRLGLHLSTGAVKKANLKHRSHDLSLTDTTSADARDFFAAETQSLDSQDKPSNSSSISIPDSSVTSHSRRLSIQIKNLPIMQASRKTSALDLSQSDDMIFAVCLVDFHHVHGPEVLWWKSNYLSSITEHLFKNLPFQALPDGSHLFEETFSNFNLVYDFDNRLSLDNMSDIESYKGNPNHLETFFGCSCVRQIKSADLAQEELQRNKEITRSIVQKAVVVISRGQPIFTKIKEKLSIITHSFFQQPSFDNYDLLESLFDNLNDAFKLEDIRDSVFTPSKVSAAATVQDQLKLERYEDQEEFFVNLNLKELLGQFKNDLLVILKAVLLEKKVLIYSNNKLELLTQFQNNIIALIPNLMNSLELSGCPLCDFTEKNSPLLKPSSLKTNDRMSMLRFFGLPLQIFNTKGSFWNPYLPLQQMEELLSETFMVGCSNLLMVNQLAHFKVDVLINLDTSLVSYPCGRPEELRLSTLDKKFISVLSSNQKDRDSFMGGDDYVRYQFEDYIRSMLATVRLMQYTERFKLPPPGFDAPGDKYTGGIRAFNEQFIAKWRATKNFQVWTATCDEFVFNFAEPVHVATDMDDPYSQSTMGEIFSSFKKVPQPPIQSLTDRANLYFSQAPKPRKFIVENNEPSETTATLEQNSVPKATPKAGWTWGFKK